MTAWELVRRNAVNVEVEPHLREKVESGRKLRVKLGIDPSAPDIHLGHTVVLGKLRDFQSLGHTAVLIIGDFTARIGDPSGRSETRPQLQPHEVDANAETYLEQVFKILDRGATEVRRQSEWFNSMSLADVLGLAGQHTLAQVTQREDFAKRIKAGDPLGMHEVFYPLLQGYDSVAVKSDVELGGTDQLFNLLFGREMQRSAGQEPQDVLTTPLLVGLDGVQKMSKSLGNYVGVTDAADDMFGKLMSLPDELIVPYLRLVTDLEEKAVAGIDEGIKNGDNPRDAKARLARAVVERFHDAGVAKAAEEAFAGQFRRGELPEDLPERYIFPKPAGGPWSVAQAVVELGLATSNSEARRLVEQRGVRLNGAVVGEASAPYEPQAGDLWQVGKRRFARVTLTPPA